MRPSRGWLLAAGALLAACGKPAPAPDPIVLGPPTDTLRTTYAEISRAVWLGGTRWAVVAPRDRAAAIVDFGAAPRGTGAVLRLGGDAASGLRNPATIFLVDDTLYIDDWGRRQTTLWTRAGILVRAVPASDAVSGALPQARDGTGAFYAELAPAGGPQSEQARDSAAVVRTSAALDRVDTVARLAPLDIAPVATEQGRRFERRVFSGNDRWGVLPDGSLWVARVYQNRVDWRAPDGTWHKGQSLPDRVLEVTRYDRELFVRRFPPDLRSMAQQLPFAAIKPPFDDAFTAADGTVWLVKSRAPTDSAGRFHVVGRDGRLLRDVRVPGNGRVIGASGDVAVVAEASREGVRLLRFDLPPIARGRP